MYTNKVPSLVKMTCKRIPLRFNWYRLIKAENRKLRNKAMRTTKDDTQCWVCVGADSAGEKTAENNNRFARERRSYKQKLAWNLETHVYCATRTNENFLIDCSVDQGAGENLCLFNKIISSNWRIIKYIQFFKGCQQ